jgi:hypothetical protein
MYPSEAAPRLLVRLPPDLKDFVVSEAQRNGSSQNSEVIRAVRERMERQRLQTKAAPEGAGTPAEA